MKIVCIFLLQYQRCKIICILMHLMGSVAKTRRPCQQVGANFFSGAYLWAKHAKKYATSGNVFQALQWC